MKVGINHPWVNYGFDFGPLVNPNATTWKTPVVDDDGTTGPLVARQLKEYKECGISTVRWFILADGWNYGTPALKDGKWTFDPPDIGVSGHAKDFEALLQAFKDSQTNIQLVPCFVDFNFFGPAKIVLPGIGRPWNVTEVVVPASAKSVDEFVKSYYDGNGSPGAYAGSATAKRYAEEQRVDPATYVKGGRSSVLQDASTIKKFLDSALQPLLAISARAEFKDLILAWDAINEPEMVLQFPGEDASARPVALTQMSGFLVEACKRIGDAGLRSTIGFQTARPLGLDDGSNTGKGRADALAKLAKAIEPIYKSKTKPSLGQFHFYPENRDQTKLANPPRRPPGAATSYAIGEFATRLESKWPGMAGADGIDVRLGLLKDAGYDFAFLWSGLNGGDHSSWTASEWEAVKRFTRT